MGEDRLACFDEAFPVIAGPGSLAAVVLVTGRTEVWLERAAVVLMVAICLTVTYVAICSFLSALCAVWGRRAPTSVEDELHGQSCKQHTGYPADEVRQAALFAPT